MQRLSAMLAVSLLLAGCVISGAAPQPNRPAIPVGPIGPIFDNPNGGPPVECRGIDMQSCFDVGIDMTGMTDPSPEQVARIIVTCVGVCQPRKGEFRIDLLLKDGSIRDFGGGGWESAG